MYCPNCGTPCHPEANFCFHCGIKLADMTAADHISPPPETEPPSPVAATPVPVEEPVPLNEPERTADEAVPELQSASGPQSTAEPRPAPELQPTVEPQPIPQPVPRKKGTHWIPILIMGLICVFGMWLFFAFPYESSAGSSSSLDDIHSQIGSSSETPWFKNMDGTLYFSGKAYSGSSSITIPDTVDGRSVTAISEGCFADCDWITTVVIPDTVTEIGSGAFANCTALRGIYLPEGLTYIGDKAFFCCSDLEAICIPSTAEEIGAYAFAGCSSLNYILYSGSHAQWQALYDGEISMKTQVYCDDGTFLHADPRK